MWSSSLHHVAELASCRATPDGRLFKTSWLLATQMLSLLRLQLVLLDVVMLSAATQAMEWRQALQLLEGHDLDTVAYNGLLKALQRAAGWAGALEVLGHMAHGRLALSFVSKGSAISAAHDQL